jgi:hypothetical protein
MGTYSWKGDLMFAVDPSNTGGSLLLLNEELK